MKTRFLTILSIACAVLLTNCCSDTQPSDVTIDFLNNRFGMFIHYNMGTFHAEQWAKRGHDPKSFNPDKLDCRQWAKAAASAKMSYAVFTTKHHDGFCLWDSSVTDYDVASSSYSGDIVKEYVDAFRAEGLKTGLYFSVWDRQHKIERGNITPEGIEYTKKQLTELLTNYGEITCLVIDGWGSIWGRSPSFEELPYAVLADHIHSLQPNCLVINHSCKTDSSLTQIVHYEATHGQHCPYDNTIPSQQGPTIQPAWFWEKGYERLDLKPVAEILSELEFCNTHTANYLLNAAPNASGLMDENVVSRLAEVGKLWVKPAPIVELPEITAPNAKVVATAQSNSNNPASNVLDADLFTVWQPAGDLPYTLTLDFGRDETFNKVVCGAGHNYRDSIEEFKIEALVGNEWVTLATGGQMSYHFASSFNDVTARKYRLVITKVKEGSKMPQVGELTFVKYNTI